jgi:uncharacterized protein (TIGR03118 family)
MGSQNWSRRTLACLASLVIIVGLIPSPAAAQYAITNLVSNQAGKAKHQDKELVNAWGMSFFPGSPFWISDNGTGVTTFYNSKGVKQGQVAVPPTCSTFECALTGQVANTDTSTTDFVVSQGGKSGPAFFIFATFEPGTISGWNPSVNANSSVVVVNGANAWYTGLAMGVNNGAHFLFGADNLNNKVDIYDRTFKLVGSFTDLKLTGLKVYNVQNINGKLYVTFSDGIPGTKGAVDIFTTAGKFVKTLTKSKALVGPWGVAMAPKNFGPASNQLLIGNVGNGWINAFNPKTKTLTPLKNAAGKPIKIDLLWALAFGQGGGMNGNPNQLFFTAGPNGYANGLFGVINFK